MRLALVDRLGRLGERGGVALMTAIVLPVLLLIGGFGIDYGYASYINQRLAQATDNAVLGSVSQSAATAVGGFGNTQELQNYGYKVFNGNVAGLQLSGVTFTLNVTSNGTGGVNSSGSYTYNYPTFFTSLLGITTIPLTSQIKASANPVTYIDYYILVDASQSMGIGATKSDMDQLYARSVQYGAGAFGEKGCVFGCHVLYKDQSGSQTNEQIAHNVSPRIKLRIDSAVEAIQSIIADAQSSAGTTKNIRIGIYMINHDPNNSSKYYTVISSPSSDYSTLSSLATAIDLGGNNSSSIGDTDLQNELTNFSAVLPSSNGSGASAVSPLNYVFLITDGLADNGSLEACIYSGVNTCSKPIAPSFCKPLKVSATVGTIYTTYNPIYTNNDSSSSLEPIFSFFVAPYLTIDKSSGKVTSDMMATNLQACSSDSSKYYFAASDGPGITTAMKALFASTLKNARLIQ